MRLNKYIALATGMSRRAADAVIAAGHVSINGQPAKTGAQTAQQDIVTLDGKKLEPEASITLMLNKPAGYVCSRAGQGNKTIYELLPDTFQSLKPVGRLDKDSSGLILLTNDGQLAQKLTHPKFRKEKVYEVRLNKPLKHGDRLHIEQGVMLTDGLSRLKLEPVHIESRAPHTMWRVTMSEGRNRQIRRTFSHLYYSVQTLHRTHFGSHTLGTLPAGQW